jgi:hypothetical protein
MAPARCAFGAKPVWIAPAIIRIAPIQGERRCGIDARDGATPSILTRGCSLKRPAPSRETRRADPAATGSIGWLLLWFKVFPIPLAIGCLRPRRRRLRDVRTQRCVTSPTGR